MTVSNCYIRMYIEWVCISNETLTSDDVFVLNEFENRKEVNEILRL